MARALQDIRKDLHISHSQIATYQNCSLKYYFHYVMGLPAESTNIALGFGGAIHAALELYYRAIQNGKTEALQAVQECFENCLSLSLASTDVCVNYNKAMPDHKAAIATGKSILEVFYQSVDLSGFELVGIELPLSAPLYTEDGQVTDFKLVGIIDLMLRNDDGQVVVVDNKTSAKSMNQAVVDNDNQLTAYSYLLAANNYTSPSAVVQARYDILVKTKTPKFQQICTQRSQEDRRRFAKVANRVLAGIDARIFFPQTSWMCSSCGYATACSKW